MADQTNTPEDTRDLEAVKRRHLRGQLWALWIEFSRDRVSGNLIKSQVKVKFTNVTTNPSRLSCVCVLLLAFAQRCTVSVSIFGSKAAVN